MEKNNLDAKMDLSENILNKKDDTFNQRKEDIIINNKNKNDEIKINEINNKKNVTLENNRINEEKNDKYIDIITNNPELLFEIITPHLISIWQSKLFTFDITVINSDNLIITTVPDRLDQNVIKIDAKRTRFREKKLIIGFEKILELIMTFYCNERKIMYKQGMNEIFGAFLLMKYKINDLKLLNILNIGESFINKFLPNYYYEKDLNSLKFGINFFSILLKYHEPNIYYYLDKYEIPHELYVTNWILTFRAQKLPIDIYYYLIDYLIQIDDPLFINFILVALIKSKREILLSIDGKNLLRLLTNLTFNTKEELVNIIKQALELRILTPYSYRFLANKMGLYQKKKINTMDNFEILVNNYIPAMPIFPLELLYQKYKYTDKIVCPDDNCPNNKKNNIITIDWGNEKIYTSETLNDYKCEKCILKIDKKINYILLDLRLYDPSEFKNEYDFFKMGIISGTFEINKEDLLSGDIDKLLSSRLLSIRGDQHIILMTSRTDYFGEFEKKFYSVKMTEEEKAKQLLGLIKEEKSEKVLNLEEFEKDLDYQELYKLKEYDNFRKILNSMRDKNFPYVSYLEGGFEAFHQECLNYKIELVEHDSNLCKLCLNKDIKHKDNKLHKKPFDKKMSENLWKNKLISINEINAFLTNKENIILICFLHKFKNNYYLNEEIEIFILFLFDKNAIEIYNKEKQINGKNSSYYNLGINSQTGKEIILRHFYSIKFKHIKYAKSNKETKNLVNLELYHKENDDTVVGSDFEFEFHSKEDTTTFKNLIKKIKNL